MKKKCTLCGEVKEIEEFYYSKTHGNYQSGCKKCYIKHYSDRRKKWYRENKDQRREYSRRYRRQHPDQVRKYQRKYMRKYNQKQMEKEPLWHVSAYTKKRRLIGSVDVHAKTEFGAKCRAKLRTRYKNVCYILVERRVKEDEYT